LARPAASALDTRTCQKGKVSKAAMKCLDITGNQFHPEWNYTSGHGSPAYRSPRPDPFALYHPT
jgi:hypothetical protein